MVEVYYYIPAEAVEDAVECGLKLSKWYDRELLFNGDRRKCLSGLLNPKDDIEKFRSDQLRCVKLEIAPNYCFAADKMLYLAGLNSEKAMELYLKSIIPIEQYIFGSYRLPECLVTSTIIGGHISLLDKRRDSPVLFNNSEELYINSIIETNKEDHPAFYDAMLYHFYSKLAETGRVSVIEDKEHGFAIFMDSEGKTYNIRVPDMGAY